MSSSENEANPPEEAPQDSSKGESAQEPWVLYIGNISYETTEDELRDKFSQFGTISRVKIPRPRGSHAGYAFIDVPDKDDASRMIESMNETEFGGRRIYVEFSDGKGRRRDDSRRRSRHDRHERRRSRSYDDYYSPPPRRRYRDDRRSRRSRNAYDDYYSPPPRRSRDRYDDYSPPPRRSSRDRYDSPPRRRSGRYDDHR
ncbi:RNA recognition motif domain containing protein [Histomonas meleagridis]|uniref:RNA recognition motif domain containing protein n=1 Tax=Histomonas meleagridis TaxID=135588 RepID=UPI003559F031|nr:RNA recognition motif domain containing protein [Histomonas meleagridis]KAH0805952.1 RNA recognition motif domain containing protein [Histomonas meleagridis]